MPHTPHLDPMAQSAAHFSQSAGQHMASGPTGLLDLILVGSGYFIVALVFFLTIKYFIRPRPEESDPNHIKRRILRDEEPRPW